MLLIIDLSTKYQQIQHCRENRGTALIIQLYKNGN